MEENVTIMTVLQELRDFRKENNKRWEANDKRWEENERRWEQNEKRWEENERRWEQNEKRWKANDKRLDAMDNRLDSMDNRVSNLEEGRKTDRREILDVLETMQKSINKQFVDMRDYMDAQFEKINAINTVNDIEHTEFRQLLKAYGIRIDLQSSRITYLEKSKKDLDESGMVAVN
jgi:chromosome segregation ATPase